MCTAGTHLGKSIVSAKLGLCFDIRVHIKRFPAPKRRLSRSTIAPAALRGLSIGAEPSPAHRLRLLPEAKFWELVRLGRQRVYQSHELPE
jgi:hypothetical protein